MCAKHYENPTMLSKVTAKNVGDVFWDTLYLQQTLEWRIYVKLAVVMLWLSNRRSKSRSFLKIALNWNRYFGWYLYSILTHGYIGEDNTLQWVQSMTVRAAACWIHRLNYTNRMPQRRSRLRGAAATTASIGIA